MRTLLAFLLLLAGCGGPQKQTAVPGGLTLRWGVSQGLWGSEQMMIFADGLVRYSFESARGEKGVHTEKHLGRAELAPLAKALSNPAFCRLKSGRNGIPDEAMPGLLFRLDASGCEVELWDGEWEDLEDARPVLEAINEIIQKMRKED